MQRIAFRLKVRDGQEQEYKRTHRNVWPEMLQALKRAGISNYSIFMDGRDLFLYLEIDADFEKAWRELSQTEISRKWQEYMSPILEPAEGLEPGEAPRGMEEVFHQD